MALSPGMSIRAPRPPTQDEAEDWAEAQEEASDRARKAQRDARRANKVSAFLGQASWREDKTWPCLYWRVGGRQSRVEMYFPALNLAVDRFPRPTSMDRQEAAFKESALRAAGVKYAALFPESSLQDLKRHV